MAEHCKDCMYYLKSVSACRRYPPSHYGQGYYKEAKSDYPSTCEYGWCGEFKKSGEIDG